MHLSSRKFLVPVAILVMATMIAAGLILSRTEPKRAVLESQPLLVNAAKVVKEDLQIAVQAQGSATPRTTTTIVAEVAGTITKVSPRFKSGGFFKTGDILLQIDQRDYLTQLKRTQAAVASAKSKLASEQGLAEVAYQDWLKYKSNVKRSQAATDLALRKPQLADAKAGLDAAMADLNRAKDQLDRTLIRAPYDGLVKSKHVDIGQYVSSGSELAETFAVDVAELRLALPQSKLNYLNLPGLTDHSSTGKPNVDLYTTIGDQQYHWQAKLVRTEGVFDQRSRVLFVVAQINDPYGLDSPQQHPLRIGTFVEASIEGKVIANLVKLPRHILRSGNQVWVIDSHQRLQNRQIKILHTQGEDMYVTAGLAEGERVSLSNIGGIISGTEVRVASLTATNSQKTQATIPEQETLMDSDLDPPADAAPINVEQKNNNVTVHNKNLGQAT